MTKIYEALEQASRDRSLPEKTIVKLPESDRFFDDFDLRLEDTLTGLYHNIVRAIPNHKSRMIQFVESGETVGASTLIREFAKISAIKFNKSVLLLDANPSRSGHADFFDINTKWDFNETFEAKDSFRNSLCPIGKSSLYVAQIAANTERFELVFTTEEGDSFFDQLKQNFDIILIDMSPSMSSAGNYLLSKNTDGVILVLEAGKTRWQVAEQLKEQIIMQGGNLLGAILNKRGYPIPKYIYDKL